MGSIDSVWHYTNTEGLRGIVSRNVLWATSHRFMNDSQEASYATRVLKDAAKKARDRINPGDRKRFDELMLAAERDGLEAFLLCAARKPDLLTVWRGYGADVSYALELDASAELLPVRRDERKTHPHPPRSWKPEMDADENGTPFTILNPDEVHIESEQWRPVEYKASEAKKRVRRIADLASKPPGTVTDALFPWLNLGGIDLLQLKHPAFRDEREARMIFDVHPRWAFVQHRSSRFGVVPYIEVSAADSGNQESSNQRFVSKPAKKLPIRSVLIGPSPLGKESITALEEFLELNGYPDTPIKKSSIPFR